MGLDMQQVGADLSASIGGNFVNRFNMDGLSYKVIPQIKRIDRLNPEQLKSIYVTGPNNQLVPLSTIASIKHTTVARSLNRMQQLNAVTISGVPAGSVDTALKFLETEAQKILPAGYVIDYIGISGQRLVDVGHFISAGVVSFARGLNDTPKIAAVLLASPILGPKASLVAVAAAMGIGGLVGARRVAETMSHKVTAMSTGQGLSASLATGSLVLAASLAGLPVSTTHVSVGSLVGIGTMNGKADPLGDPQHRPVVGRHPADRGGALGAGLPARQALKREPCRGLLVTPACRRARLVAHLGRWRESTIRSRSGSASWTGSRRRPPRPSSGPRRAAAVPTTACPSSRSPAR